MSVARPEKPQERELKFAGIELGALRERLVELEAERVAAAAFEDNWIFDRDGELLADERVLRLRIDGQGAELTFKGAPRFAGNAKVRVELQTRVADAEQMRSLLEALGYRVARRYQKMREEWRLGGVVVALDHTPIGDFAELEGSGCEKLARRCGLAPEKAERRTYLQLYEEYLREHPEAPPEMTFE
ncbi:MAG TPA: class IV adenylate cyclase [Thermoanaerobaculia bacterium]|nr:class IV adenylate cyclase [Thermoanaerobaculia bacterium]